MYARFLASLPAKIAVPDQPVPIQHYLRQPQRLVNALVDPTRLERLQDDRFRINVRPLNFMMLSIQPVVDLKIWAEPNGTIHLRSVGCKLRDMQYVNERFHLRLIGKLVPTAEGSMTYLKGEADLEVNVELPPALWFTPQPMLEGAGNALLMSVLHTIEQRLMRQLIADYLSWASDQTQTRSARIEPLAIRREAPHSIA
jgi:Protein of unknown function (DUF1997)